MERIVFVTGGVSSSLGKGITAASLGRLLVGRGFRVRNIKLDPYLNIDPGVLAPGEHGEVFVTADGAETDLDLGHYERFTGQELSGDCSVSAGKVYQAVLANERRGEYQGKTVQVVPHVTDEIKRRIRLAAGWETGQGVDVLIVEIGGTVGDIEILPFLEAVRQMRAEMDLGSTCSVHLTLVPAVGPNEEPKTKPSQHSVQMLRSQGLTPDVLVARGRVDEHLKEKLARTCGLHRSRVVAALDAPSIYQVPENLAEEGLDQAVCDVLGLDGELELDEWRAAVTNLVTPPTEVVRVGVVAKYSAGADTYLSVCEALSHAGAARGVSVEKVWLDAETFSEGDLDALDAVVVPGGFGVRGVEGKMLAARSARHAKVPYLGLCLGMQVAVVDAAREMGLEATSAEWESEGVEIVGLMESQRDVELLGGTQRLGAFEAHLVQGSVVAGLYGATSVVERHRHRYEVAGWWKGVLRHAGLEVSGTSPDGKLVEFVEGIDHPFFVATQAHPEFVSRPDAPHPLFTGLVGAAILRAAVRSR